MRQSLRQSAEHVVQTLHEKGFLAYFAGGCVRDMLLGIPPCDYDLATDATPEQITSIFPNTRKVGAQFGVVLVRMNRYDLEVATFRTDGRYSDHRRPDTVEFSTPERDACRRDFTINGMFYDPLRNECIDFVQGQEDLKRKVIRAIGVAEERFNEDYLRMLRAIRFTTRLGFELESETRSSICRNAFHIKDIAPERVQMELEKILTGPDPSRGWTLIHQTTLSDYLVPSVSWNEAVSGLVAERLSKLPEKPSFALSLAAILLGQTTKQAYIACRELRCSNDVTNAVTWMLSCIPTLESIESLELADIKFLCGDSRFELLASLFRANVILEKRNDNSYQKLMKRVNDIRPEEIAPPPLLTGDDLLGMGYQQSREFSSILESVYRAQLNNRIMTRDEARKLGDKLMKELAKPKDC